jgi:adenylate cyclase
LHVVARSSSFSFKRKPAGIQDIARRLNVGAIVQGSVRRDGDRVVIKAKMLDGVTGGLIWSATYDRDENQILRTQQDLASNRYRPANDTARL